MDVGHEDTLIPILNNETFHVSCTGFVPKFNQIFSNLEFVYLMRLDEELLNDVKALMNSYQPLRRLSISFNNMTDFSFDEMKIPTPP